VLFCLSTVFAQKQTVYLSYPSELPFQTSNDSEYYHLEASLLIRQILSDMNQILEKNQNKKQDIEFNILIKNNYGAVQPIDYLVDANSYYNKLSKNTFLSHSYDWINRTFRSNIPYED
jgi:hypothetical protein